MESTTGGRGGPVRRLSVFRRLDPGRHIPSRPYPAGGLPAIVREGLVGLRHLVCVFALLDRAPLVARGGEDLSGEFFPERVIRPLLGEGDEPACRQGVTSLRTNLDRDLIVGSAHPPRLDLEHRL